jgi:integrase
MGRADFVLYYSHLLKSGRSAKTLDVYTSSIRAFFKWLQEWGFYDKDITAGTRNKRRYSDYVRSPLSIEQADQLLKSCNGMSLIDKRNYAILNLMLFLGLRRCEVSRLDMRDIYQQEDRYYIRIQGKGHVDKDSILKITKDIISPIDDYWSLRTDIFKANTAAFLSHARRGEARLTPSFISKMVKSHLRKIGLNDPVYSSHSLRHTAAILAMKAGSSVDEVRSMLRHRSASVTELYLKQLNRDEDAGNTAISNLGQYYQKFKETAKKVHNSGSVTPQSVANI